MKGIRRIDTATNFGSYHQFVWDTSVEGFKRFNLLYGWNYSGKTTLSRMFSVLGGGRLSDGFNSSHFQVNIEDEAGTFTQVDSRMKTEPLKIRVFNKDFVVANFQQEHNAPAVHILGESVKEFKDERDRYNQNVLRLQDAISLLRKQKLSKESEFDEQRTGYARTINAAIGGRYDRRNLDVALPGIRGKEEQFHLSEATLDTYRRTLASADEYIEIDQFSIMPPNLVDLIKKANLLLTQTATNRAITELKGDKILEGWLRSGLEIHQGKQVCAFCNNPLQNDVLERLNGHFSKELESLRCTIQLFIENDLPKEFNVSLPDESRFLPNLRIEYKLLTAQLDAWVIWCNLQLSLITQAIEKKLEDGLDQTRSLTINLCGVEDFFLIKEKIKDVINRHDLTIIDKVRLTQETKNNIEAHYISELCLKYDMNIYDAFQSLLNRKIEKRIWLVDAYKARIISLESELRKKSVATAKLNELLDSLLPNGDVRVVPVGDSAFEFQRSGVAAKNLSDGEKTAITFAYFLISLEDNDNKIEDTVVFIDDPISSLDSNHIYSVYALIKERLMKARQLFVSTHNSDLFGLIRDEWLGRHAPNPIKSVSSGYLITRSIIPLNSSSRISILPDLLKKYKTEYQFIFKQLYDFSRSTTPSLQEAYTSPMLVRKFLESYLGFRCPKPKSWGDKLDILFSTEIECSEIRKFADEVAHSQSIQRGLLTPEYAPAAQSMVKKIIDALSNKDEMHYQGLLDSIQ